MTERMTENRIRKLSVLEEKGVEEQKTKNFIIRWKEIANNRLDGKALKASFSDICSQFVKKTASRRFTVV